MRQIGMLPLLAVLCAPPAASQPASSDAGAMMRAGDWVSAERAVAATGDPLATRLLRWRRALAAGAASATEIAAVIAASAGWPQAATLVRRRDEALAAEPDDAQALLGCDAAPAVSQAAARLRCADAFAHAGRAADSVRLLRLVWVDGPSDPDWEQRTASRAGAAVTAADQWRRFDRLAWSDTAGARRQAVRLDAADRPRAEARLALRSDDVSALALMAALPASQRAEPSLVLEELRWLARAGQDADALALWRTVGPAAEHAAPPERRAAFWTERNALARRLLRMGDNAGAYALVAGHAQTASEQVADAEFLAGFIALRRLGDAATARRHFGRLALVAAAPISQARAHFWLARAAADPAGAASEYRAAARYDATYYGQLAALALGDGEGLAVRLAAARDPAPESSRGEASEPLRAAVLLAGWGETRLAASFLQKLADDAADPAERLRAARLAQTLCPPDVAVGIARRLARDGVVLIEAGWPMAADVPPASGVDPALALALIRQESSFDPNAVSPAGARGLMQLMPATATAVARQLGVAAPPASLVGDPALNLRLGTAFLRTLLDRYGDAIPLAVAAYNAGPSRVADWLAAFGDPRAGGADVIDWIELIGFNETRNYIQRVIENTVIYRARRGEPDLHPLARWLR